MAGRGPHNNAITWTPHVRVAWGGPLASEGEIWTNSLKWVSADNSTITAEQAQGSAPGVWAALAAAFADSYFSITNQASITWLKINGVGVSGLQAAGDTNVYSAAAPIVGVVSTVSVPLYQTFAVTLRSQLKRGRGHVGRIFPPTVYGGVDGNGRLSAVMAGHMADSWATCIQAMQLALRTGTGSAGGHFSVLSPGNTTKSQLPVENLIRTVEVDTVPDVQHRRTNRLARHIGSTANING